MQKSVFCQQLDVITTLALPELIYHKIEITSQDCKEPIFSTSTRGKKKLHKIY